VEPVTAGAMSAGEPLFGLFRTLGPVAYAFWLLSALGWAVLRPAPSRVLIAVSIAVTLALPVVAPLTGVDRPPLWVMLALVRLRPAGTRRLGTGLGRLPVHSGRPPQRAGRCRGRHRRGVHGGHPVGSGRRGVRVLLPAHDRPASARS
jgi:hypothetical protein